MKRQEVLHILERNREQIRSLHVKSLSLFGSVARDEATPMSDIDLLVEFEDGHPGGLFEFLACPHALDSFLP